MAKGQCSAVERSSTNEKFHDVIRVKHMYSLRSRQAQPCPTAKLCTAICPLTLICTFATCIFGKMNIIDIGFVIEDSTFPTLTKLEQATPHVARVI